MTPTNQFARLSDLVREATRERAIRSPMAFATLYFQHYLNKPPSVMHREVNEILLSVAEEPGGRFALAAPRGSAKSTLVTLMFALWCICHKKFRFIVLISDTAEKACEFLDHIKQELVGNGRLAEDYPEVCEPNGRAPRWPRWRKQEILAHNGVKVLAMGSGQSIRGRRNQETRPDLILLDDVECRDNTQTPEARRKLSDWFNQTILKAGTKDTRIVVVGTIQHYDALLARLTDPGKSPMWQSRIYRSVISWAKQTELWEQWLSILRKREDYDNATGAIAARTFFDQRKEQMLEGTEVLWPETEDYYFLQLMRENDGPASFDSEKQNQPVNPEDCYFLEEDFQFWEDQFENEKTLVSTIGSNAQIIGACDPSLGKRGRHGDDSAIITLLRDKKSGTLYVLDADIQKRKPDNLIETILSYQSLRKYYKFGFETNQFQDFVADELGRRSKVVGLYLPIFKIQHTTDKLGRIQSLQALVRSGAILFSRRQHLLLEQLRYFPKAAHDDGPDALEMAVETAKKGSGPAMPIFTPVYESPWQNLGWL